MKTEIEDVLIEDAELAWLNFAGVEKEMNREGARNFCVFLPDRTATDLLRAGWNVKNTRPREEGDPERPYIQVAVGYKIRPPAVWMVTSRGRTLLTEEMVDLLDSAEITKADVIIKASSWERMGRSGIKAYLKTGFFFVAEDYLEEKYADIPKAGG